jgi:hypothetical protein
VIFVTTNSSSFGSDLSLCAALLFGRASGWGIAFFVGRALFGSLGSGRWTVTTGGSGARGDNLLAGGEVDCVGGGGILPAADFGELGGVDLVEDGQ